MKRGIGLFWAMCLALFICLPAVAEGGCWYLAKYGTHDFEQVDIKLPSCETDGYYILECRQCGLNEKHITERATGHAWRMTESVGSTCSQQGYEKYVCDSCNKTRTTTFPKLHHVWVDGEVLESATCTQEGSVRTYCSLCHLSSNRKLPKLYHIWIDGEVLEAATCKQEGSVRTYCSLCHMSGNRKTAKTAHTYGLWNVTVQATDHSQGQRTCICSVCGDKQTENFYPDGTLYRGMDKSDNVASCQQLLIDLGFLKDKADGVFGKKTEQAVKDFQSEDGLEVTGIAYPQTQSAIAERYKQLTSPAIKPAETLEPESTPIPMPDAPQETAYCRCDLSSDGMEQVAYCERHQALIDEFEAKLEAADTDEVKLLVLSECQEAWQAELERLYDAYLASATPEEKPYIAQAKSMFALFLSNQETLWTRKYASQPVVARQNVINALIRQCVDLCPFAVGNDITLVGFAFSENGMSLDEFRSYAVVRTEQGYQADYDLFGGRSVFSLRMNDEDIEVLKRIIQSHHLAQWNGFYKTNSHVLDGSSFDLSIALDDGTRISASGGNDFPSGYEDARNEIIDFFQNIMERNGIRIEQ